MVGIEVKKNCDKTCNKCHDILKYWCIFCYDLSSYYIATNQRQNYATNILQMNHWSVTGKHCHIPI